MMKRIILHKVTVSIFAFFGVIFLAKGQNITNFEVSLAKWQSITDNSIGIRLGYEKEIVGEISYQRQLFETNRLEVDLGFRNQDIIGTTIHETKFTAIYQQLWNIPERYAFYIGLGAGVGYWNYRVQEKNYSDTGMYSYLAGQVGVEYNFEYIPFSVSLDCRPEYINKWWRDTNLVADVSLGFRYKF